MQTDFDDFLQDLAHGQHHPHEHDWSEGGTVHTNDEPVDTKKGQADKRVVQKTKCA